MSRGPGGERSCELLPLGWVRSCGLLRPVRSCELLGLTPGARPTVELSAGDGAVAPGWTDGWPVGGAGVAGAAAPEVPVPPLPPEV
jgi:hypothetical protein